MPFRIPLSGLNSALTGLRTTANNIANVATSGFRQSRTELAEQVANGVGRGVRVGAIARQDTQGTFRFTNNALDFAIGGNGYFMLSNGGSRLYTRNGEFGVDSNGYIVNARGARLQGYSMDSSGQVNTGVLTDLQMSKGSTGGIGVDPGGVVFARYSDGRSEPLGKVAIAVFTNPGGLQNAGTNEWTESSASGAATLGEAGTASFGRIQSGALENSNVDLTDQLLDMIKFSRQIEAQAKVIQTERENAESIANLFSKRPAK